MDWGEGTAGGKRLSSRGGHIGQETGDKGRVQGDWKFGEILQ